MTDAERAAARALSGCRLPPASWIKRFSRDMAARAEQTDAAALSEKQREWLWKLTHKFRRQMFKDGAGLTAEQVRRHFGDCVMNEQQWLTSTDPQAMLKWIRETGGETSNRPRNPPGDRKLRLFACACCLEVWSLLTDERSRRAVEVAERYADGRATEKELSAAWNAAWNAAESAASSAARSAAWNAPQGTQAELLRCIFGNPFRPVHCLCGMPANMRQERCPKAQAILRWHDGTVPKIAQAIYQDRDFDRMPILADALEEAGCENADILEHCRRPGEHVRGCWVVDLVLGKE